MGDQCTIESPCVSAAILMARIEADERMSEAQRETLCERLDKLEEKIDQALAERNMALGAVQIMTRIGGALMVAVPGLAWAYDHGLFDSLRHPPR